MTEVFVYHLQRQPLEAVLPVLVERSADRGWRALVKVASAERMAALDDHLWTYADESFLAHGTDAEAEPESQPVLLTLGDQNRNGARFLLLADGAAVPDEIGGYDRVALLLDGHDEGAVAAAREDWRRLKAAGHDLAYWQQDDEGRWRKVA